MTATGLKCIVTWLLQIPLSALFAVQAFVKLRGSSAWVSRFRGWGYPKHFYMVVGVLELLGAIALLIPRFARFGALLLMVVMVGASVTHLLHREPQLITTAVLLVFLTVVFYQRRRGAAVPLT